MDASFHVKKPFDVLENEESGLMPPKHFHDNAEECPARVFDALFLARAAKRLTGESTRQEFMRRQFVERLPDITLTNRTVSKSVRVDFARLRTNVICPNGFHSVTVRSDPEAANSRKKLYGLHSALFQLSPESFRQLLGVTDFTFPNN
jgi:hypothetical protein